MPQVRLPLGECIQLVHARGEPYLAVASPRATAPTSVPRIVPAVLGAPHGLLLLAFSFACPPRLAMALRPSALAKGLGAISELVKDCFEIGMLLS